MQARKNILLLSREPDYVTATNILAPFGQVTYTDKRISKFNVDKKYDIAVAYSYAPILKDSDIAEIGCEIINVHPSYLPWGQGVYPILWAAYNGTPQGASIFLIVDNGIDSGPIVERERIDLHPNITFLQARTMIIARASCLMLGVVARKLVNNQRLVATPQKDLENSVWTYRNRRESLELLANFPDKWNTTLGAVRDFQSNNKSKSDRVF